MPGGQRQYEPYYGSVCVCVWAKKTKKTEKTKKKTAIAYCFSFIYIKISILSSCPDNRRPATVTYYRYSIVLYNWIIVGVRQKRIVLSSLRSTHFLGFVRTRILSQSTEHGLSVFFSRNFSLSVSYPDSFIT